MRSVRSILLVVLALPAFAGVPSTNLLELTDGTIYRDVKFKRADGQSVTIVHSAGMATIPVRDLPQSAQALFGLTNLPDAVAPVPASVPATATSAAVRATAPTGYRVCPGCNGVGSSGCPTCRGQQFGPDKVVETKCAMCSGLGHVWVPAYRSFSGGAGKRVNRVQVGNDKRTCEKCDGNGKIETRERTYCVSCQGRGVAVCAVCKGARVVKDR